MKNSTKKKRDLRSSRDEILSAAFREIYAGGFQGVSVDDILKKTSLTKGAFYHQFSSKLELGYALVDEVISPMIIARWIDPLAHYKNPLEGILAQLDKFIGKASAAQLRLGCPLNNLVQEMSSVDKEFQRRLKKALRLWICEVEKQLQRAKSAQYLKPEINTQQVALFIVMAHEGFYGTLKGLGDPRSSKTLIQSLRNYFQTLEA